MKFFFKTSLLLKSKESFLSLQFRYKSRVYNQPHVEEKQISKLHTKVRSHKYTLCKGNLRQCKTKYMNKNITEVGRDSASVGGEGVRGDDGFCEETVFLH